MLTLNKTHFDNNGTVLKSLCGNRIQCPQQRILYSQIIITMSSSKVAGKTHMESEKVYNNTMPMTLTYRREKNTSLFCRRYENILVSI